MIDVVAKLVLVLAVARVALDREWGNLEGKAPGTRAVTYPLLAFLVPLAHLIGRPAGPYPWLADLMVTVPAYSDVLGNRFDMYDQVDWFDDLMHFVNTGTLGAAAVVLAGATGAPLAQRVTISVAAGMSVAVVWEVWEYFAFVTRSQEIGTAYADTVGDVALGWLGCVVSAAVEGLFAPEPAGTVASPPPPGRAVPRAGSPTVS